LKVFKMSADEKVLLIRSKVNLVQFENPVLISNNNQAKQVNTIFHQLDLDIIT